MKTSTQRPRAVRSHRSGKVLALLASLSMIMAGLFGVALASPASAGNSSGAGVTYPKSNSPEDVCSFYAPGYTGYSRIVAGSGGLAGNTKYVSKESYGSYVQTDGTGKNGTWGSVRPVLKMVVHAGGGLSKMTFGTNLPVGVGDWSTPLNPSGNAQMGVSTITFCYDKSPTPVPASPEVECDQVLVTLNDSKLEDVTVTQDGTPVTATKVEKGVAYYPLNGAVSKAVKVTLKDVTKPLVEETVPACPAPTPATATAECDQVTVTLNDSKVEDVTVTQDGTPVTNPTIVDDVAYYPLNGAVSKAVKVTLKGATEPLLDKTVDACPVPKPATAEADCDEVVVTLNESSVDDVTVTQDGTPVTDPKVVEGKAYYPLNGAVSKAVKVTLVGVEQPLLDKTVAACEGPTKTPRAAITCTNGWSASLDGYEANDAVVVNVNGSPVTTDQKVGENGTWSGQGSTSFTSGQPTIDLRVNGESVKTNQTPAVCTGTTPPVIPPTTTPDPETPAVVETATVTEAPAEEAVAAPEEATVAEAAPGTVAVPAAATVPASVPAGDGSQAPGLPMWALALVVVGVLGAAGAAKGLLKNN